MARDIKRLPVYAVSEKSVMNHRSLLIAKHCGYIRDNIHCPDGFASFLCANSRIFIQNGIPGNTEAKTIMAELIDMQIYNFFYHNSYHPKELQLIADRINVDEEDKVE